MCVSFGIRASDHVRQNVRRPPRCGSTAVLPWRTNIAVVLSIAAIAGCGQAPGPQAASNLSSGTTETASETGVRPSASGDEVQDPGAAATTEGNGRRDSGDAGEPGDAAAGGSGAGAQDDHPPSDLPSETTAAPTPSAEELAPPASAPPRAQGLGDVDDEGDIDTLEHTVVALLGTARKEAGAAQLHIDATLVGSARERACTMAQGTTPLLSEDDDTENVGLVVEAEPDMAARAMHDWWMETSGTRDLRLTRNFDRYGVGACIAGDRVYYAERFGS